MRSWAFAGALLLLAAVPALAQQRPSLVYPAAPRWDEVDTYYGTPVPDPYRPLENADAPGTQAWLKAEAALTRGYLDALPYRAEIRAAMRARAPTAARETALERYGEFWSMTRRAPGKRTVTFVRDGALQDDRVLLDENALPANVRVAYSNWSRSGRFFAYATETNGSDWLTWHVRDVTTAADLPDVVRWSKYAGVVFNGDDGFYYGGYRAPAPGHETDPNPAGFYNAFYHRIGTPQSADILVAAGKDDRDFPFVQVTHDGRHGVLTYGWPDANGYDVFPADRPGAPRERLFEPGDAGVQLVDSRGSHIFFETKVGSPNGRIVEVDVDDPAHRVHTVVPENADTLRDASMIRDRLYLGYLHDVHTVIAVADLAGHRVGTIALPGLGTATVPYANDGDTFADYTYESFTEPQTTYRLDLATGKSSVVARDPTPFDGTPYTTEQLFATSKDGTRVPVFVTHRRDMRYDGSTPTTMWGYGAFGDTFTLTPGFESARALWLRMGGAVAVVNARGGGEYGERWHRAAMLDRKQRTFDDVIAAAELLVARKITSPAKLALTGASAGGLMVGAVVTERPDLFGAAIADAGTMDMLRFPRTPLGAATAVEMGRTDESEAAFRALYAYSPLHNVRAGTRYPAILVTTGDHDDRVPPYNSYKFAAALQAAQGGDAPILLAVSTNGGHDFGIAGSGPDRLADRYAFLAKALDFKPSL